MKGIKCFPAHPSPLLIPLLLCAVGHTAQASNFDSFSGSLKLEQNYEEKRLRDTGKDWSDIYPVIELDARKQFDEDWKFRGVFTIEPLQFPESGEDRVYGGLDLRAKDVYLEYSKDDTGAQIGRITAPFGTAWYLAPGLDATLLAEAYVIWDRAGIKGRKDLETKRYGTVTAEAAWFMLDTTLLARSARGLWRQRRTAQGGLSNTKYPKSFSVSLSGNDSPVVKGLGWNLGLERQAVDQRADDPNAPTKDQYGLVIGANYTNKATDELSFFSIAEFAAFENRKGVPGLSAAYLSLGQRISYGKYRLELSGTGERFRGDASGNDTDNYLGAITLGYDFTSDLKLDLGYRVFKNFAPREDFIRVRLAYFLRF